MDDEMIAVPERCKEAKDCMFSCIRGVPLMGVIEKISSEKYFLYSIEKFVQADFNLEN